MQFLLRFLKSYPQVLRQYFHSVGINSYIFFPLGVDNPLFEVWIFFHNLYSMKAVPLLLGVGAFLLLRGSQKLNAVGKMKFDLDGFPSISIVSGRANLSFRVRATNMTAETFSVKNIFSRILVNNVFVGDVTSVAPFTVASYGSSIISLTASLTLSNALLVLADALTKSASGTVLTFQGSVTTGSLTFPLFIEKRF